MNPRSFPAPWRPRVVGALVSLPLGLLACASSSPRPAQVSVAAAPATTASVAPLGSHAARPDLEPDEAAISADAGLLRGACPRDFVLGESSCTTLPSDVRLSELLTTIVDGALVIDESLVTRRARTMLRLAEDRDPETAAIGRYLLARNRPSLLLARDVGARSPVCADAALARRLFDVFEPLVDRPLSRSDAESLMDLGSLAVCGDVDALGLTACVQKLGRRQIPRDPSANYPQGWTSGWVWIMAHVHNPRSEAMRALFFEGFESLPGHARDAVVYQSPLPHRPPLNEPLCTRLLQLALSDTAEAPWAAQSFGGLAAMCLDRRAEFQQRLEALLGDRATSTSHRLRAGMAACEGTDEVAIRARFFDLIRPSTSPAITDTAVRSGAWQAACRCDPARASGLLKQAQSRGDAVARDVLGKNTCP